MVQDVVLEVYRWITGASQLLYRTLPTLIFLLAVLGVLWLALRKIDGDRAQRLEDWSKWAAMPGLRFVGLALSVLLLCGLMVRARSVVDVRRETIRGASSSRRNEPSLSGVVQFAPSVAVVESKTYTRSITMPPDFLTRIGSEGLQVLSPYLQDPSAESVSKVADSFRRNGQEVIFTRELTRLDETSVAADAADVKLNFESQGSGSGQRHYIAQFASTYRFHNPRSEPVTMVFTFPLPQGGGTIQGFGLRVGNQTITEPGENGQYSWRGTVGPGASMTIQPGYKLTGAGGFEYALGSERRRIGDFHLVANSDRLPKFGKAGIFPSAITGNRAEWKLKDVLTAQNVSLVFPRVDLGSELLNKTLMIMPVALVLFGIGAAWVNARRALTATVAFGLGLLATPILAAYMSPSLATAVGAGLALVVGVLLLGRRGFLVAIACAALAAAFLTVEHGALVAWVLAAVVLVAFILQRRQESRPVVQSV